MLFWWRVVMKILANHLQYAIMQYTSIKFFYENNFILSIRISIYMTDIQYIPNIKHLNRVSWFHYHYHDLSCKFRKELLELSNIDHFIFSLKNYEFHRKFFTTILKYILSPPESAKVFGKIHCENQQNFLRFYRKLFQIVRDFWIFW